MTELTEANPAEPENTDVSTPEPEADTQSEIIEDDDNEEDESEEDLDLIANSEPELVEVEYEGAKVKVPANVKEALMRQSDYTKKTMSLAEERQAFEAQKTAAQEKWQSDEKAFNDTIELRQIEQQLEQAKQIDWDAWEQTNPTQAARGLFEMQQLQAKYGNIKSGLTAHKEQLDRQSTESFEQSRQTALDNASKTIPNWSDEKRAALENVGIELGFDKSDVSQINDAKFFHLLHFAQIGRETVNGRKAAATQKAAQAGEPVTQIKGKGAGVKKSPAKMSDAELHADYLNRRKKQLNG